MKKLPKLFTNSFDKKIDNSIEYTIVKDDINEKRTINRYEINRKIDNIFKSSSYIYKIKVKLLLKDKNLEEYIIGRDTTRLITINNEYINISDILDIEELNN